MKQLFNTLFGKKEQIVEDEEIPNQEHETGLNTDVQFVLDMLLLRILHPSGLIRERSINSLAKLILKSDNRGEIEAEITNWIIKQKLETYAFYGLLIYYRAKLLDVSYSEPNLSQIFQRMEKPSILSWMVVHQMDPDFKFPHNVFDMHSISAPPDYRLSESILNDRYVLWNSLIFLLSDIEEIATDTFIKQFGYESEYLFEELGYRPKIDSINYRGSLDFEYLASADFPINEVYISAFLRTLSWAISNSISLEKTIQIAVRKCPIDLGLWKIKPISKPDYWLNINEVEAVIDDLWSQTELLWRNKEVEDSWVLAETRGRIGDKNDCFYDLKISGFFKEVVGENDPEIERLVNWLNHNPCIKNENYWPVFKGEIQSEPFEKYVTPFEDWNIIPSSWNIFSPVDTNWQFWRAHRFIFFPAPYLVSEKIQYSCSESHILISSKGDLIAKWSDWTDGFREKRREGVTLRTGNQLLIKKTILDEFETKANSNFCWGCSIDEYEKTLFDRIPNKTQHFRIFS